MEQRIRKRNSKLKKNPQTAKVKKKKNGTANWKKQIL